MEKIYFHNRFDTESKYILETLSPDVRVVDIFNGGEIPPNLKISRLPYLVDREFALDSQGPYTPGVISLQFSCRDADGNLLAQETGAFFVEIEGQTYSIEPEGELLLIELECPIPKTISIKIEGDGYWPWIGTIEVI